MRQVTKTPTLESRGKGLTEITGAIAQWVADAQIENGLLTLFCRHTSASLLIQENADPDALADLAAFRTDRS